MCLYISDEQYSALKAALAHRGKGRPPSAPQVELNNKLLVQLSILKEEEDKTWAEIENLLIRLFPNTSFKDVYFTISAATKEMKGIKTQSELETFLNTNKDSITFPGRFCKELGISRANLITSS